MSNIIEDLRAAGGDGLDGHCPACDLGRGEHECGNSYLTPIRITTGPDAGKMVQTDIYDLLQAFGVSNVAQAQAIKKLLRGGRAGKSWRQDLEEAIASTKRAIEMEEGRNTTHPKTKAGNPEEEQV